MPEDLLGLLGLLKPEQAEVVKSALTAKDTEIATLTGTIEDLKKAAPAPAAPAQEPAASEEILKGASPELVDMVNKMQGQITELLNKEADSVAKAKFETVKAIPCAEDDLMEVLKSASPKVYEVLKAAAKAIEEGLLKAAGAAGGSEPTGETEDVLYGKLEKSAREIMAKESLTFEQAFVKACDADRETYAKYVKEAK